MQKKPVPKRTAGLIKKKKNLLRKFRKGDRNTAFSRTKEVEDRGGPCERKKIPEMEWTPAYKTRSRASRLRRKQQGYAIKINEEARGSPRVGVRYCLELQGRCCRLWRQGEKKDQVTKKEIHVPRGREGEWKLTSPGNSLFRHDCK